MGGRVMNRQKGVLRAARQLSRAAKYQQKKMAPPGRPYAEHVWKDGFGWVHEATGEPFSQAVYRAGVLRRQAGCERRRYWDPSTGVRERRHERTKQLAAKRCGPPKQLTLDQVRSGIQVVYESLKETDNENG